MQHRQHIEISATSRRIARNTVLLYFRMLLLMFIGLFTSRIVLEQLGVSDYGVWNAVGGVVTGFTFITTAISNAISRFLDFEIGQGDKEKLQKVFATSVIIQIALAILLVILVESLGMWLLQSKMSIPEGREDISGLVLHCSLGILVINMLSVPYNAAIIAHERMSAFALISIIEAALKLGVALLLALVVTDKLALYAFLMLAVALITRLCYGLYCRRHFEECRTRLMLDKPLLKQMTGFAGWSFLGNGAYVLNNQGVTIIINIFFGVLLNAARGVATMVEGIVKQFATNFLTALNPQITKSWAAGNKSYCFELVSKGAKFTYLILLALLLPLYFETDLLLELWLKDVPEHASQFTRLSLIALLLGMTSNPLTTLQQATGRIRHYYIAIGSVNLLALPLVWLLFRCGATAATAYLVIIGVCVLEFILKLLISARQTGFHIGQFLLMVLLPLLAVTVLALVAPVLICQLMQDGWLRLLLVCVGGWVALAVSAYGLALTKGERAWLLQKLRNE